MNFGQSLNLRPVIITCLTVTFQEQKFTATTISNTYKQGVSRQLSAIGSNKSEVDPRWSYVTRKVFYVLQQIFTAARCASQGISHFCVTRQAGPEQCDVRHGSGPVSDKKNQRSTVNITKIPAILTNRLKVPFRMSAEHYSAIVVAL